MDLFILYLYCEKQEIAGWTGRTLWSIQISSIHLKLTMARYVGSCVIKASMVECWSVPWIDLQSTMNGHLDWRSICVCDRYLVDQQSFDSRLSVDRLICINWLVTDCRTRYQSSVNQGVSGVLSVHWGRVSVDACLRMPLSTHDPVS